MTLAEASRSVDSLIAEVAGSGVKEVVDIGSRLEGLTRHASVHAAGVVIAPVRSTSSSRSTRPTGTKSRRSGT